MSSLEERVAYLEGRLEDHVTAVDRLRSDGQDLREAIGQLGERMDRRFDTLDEKVDRHFTWLAGIQVATLVAVVSALVSGYYR